MIKTRNRLQQRQIEQGRLLKSLILKTSGVRQLHEKVICDMIQYTSNVMVTP